MSFALGARAAGVLRTGNAARARETCRFTQQQQLISIRQPSASRPLSMLRATSPRLRRPPAAAASRASRASSKKGPRSDVWPESVNRAPPKPSAAYRPHNPSGLPPPDLPNEEDMEYEKDDGITYYDEAAERARARREHDERTRRSYQEHRQTVNQLFAQRQLPLVGAALAAGVLGFCTMPLLFEYMMGRCNECVPAEVDPDAIPTGLPPMGAAAFDVSLDVPERMMGIGRLRTRLASVAQGDVLEVAVGTGRNIRHYAWNPYVFEPEHSRIPAIAPDLGDARPLTSFTGVDLSAEALAIARRRLRVNVPAVRRAVQKQGKAGEAAFNASIPEGDGASGPPTEVFSMLDERLRLFRGDALNPLPPAAHLEPAPRGPPGKPAEPAEPYTGRYDTVVQTFGLCSVADPVLLLQHMAAAVKPDSGRIVLLEHGRSQWSLVNGLLDRYASRHFSRFGCWWNRDLLAIVDKAKQAVPGLEVVEVTRPGWFQFGTLYWIELRVKGSSNGQ